MENLIKNNFLQLKKRIEGAAKRAGRDPKSVRLMGASKTQPVDAVMEAYEAGLRLFGENRVAEGTEKFKDLPDDIELHLIGHLQRNKAKSASSGYSCIQSIDKKSTADALCRFIASPDSVLRILLEVNTSGEESKQGCVDESALFDLVDQLIPMEQLKIEGLMTIGPFTSDEHLIRKSFSRLRTIFETCRSRYPALDMHELSMGMSSDFEIAIEEGSTLVRVGSALFGSRDYA